MYEDADLYSQYSLDHQNEAKRMLHKYGHHLTWDKLGETVLDIGCGSGDVTNNIIKPFLSPTFKALVGVDISEKMVQYARKKWPLDPRVHFHTLDISKPSKITALPLTLQQYDKIFSFFCLQWVSDRRAAAKSIHRLLKPGGQAFLLLVVNSGIYLVWDTIAKSKKWKKYFKGVVLLPMNEYVYMNAPDEVFCKSVRSVGLIIKECIIEVRKNVFTTSTHTDEEMTDRLRTVDPLITYIPEHLKDDYMREVLDLTKKIVSPKGATDYSALIVVLKKQI
ncbi:juvenile hormone acid O-methyltransferase-like isoform X2 [Rhodnius prolixus]